MAHDQQHDWRTELSRHQARAASEGMSDTNTVLRFLFMLPIHFLMLPIRLRGVLRRGQEMREFALQRAGNRLTTNDLTREIAVEWEQIHPEEFPLGEYDPKVSKLQRTFNKMLAKRNR